MTKRVDSARTDRQVGSGTIFLLVAVCDLCGTRSAEADGVPASDGAEAIPLTWSTALVKAKPVTYCDRCSREHLRSIEAKLEAEWW